MPPCRKPWSGGTLQGSWAAQHQTESAPLGTPAYMSPEQAGGEAELDGRSDGYSLGCVLYEMVAGSPPFAGRTPLAAIASRLIGPPRPIEQFRPGLPPQVEQVLARALAFEPAERFETAGALAGIEKEAASQPRNDRSWVKRRPRRRHAPPQ